MDRVLLAIPAIIVLFVSGILKVFDRYEQDISFSLPRVIYGVFKRIWPSAVSDRMGVRSVSIPKGVWRALGLAEALIAAVCAFSGRWIFVVVVFVLLSVFLGGSVWLLRHGREKPCACLGMRWGGTPSVVHVVVLALLAGGAGIGLGGNWVGMPRLFAVEGVWRLIVAFLMALISVVLLSSFEAKIGRVVRAAWDEGMGWAHWAWFRGRHTSPRLEVPESLVVAHHISTSIVLDAWRVGRWSYWLLPASYAGSDVQVVIARRLVDRRTPWRVSLVDSERSEVLLKFAFGGHPKAKPPLRRFESSDQLNPILS